MLAQHPMAAASAVTLPLETTWMSAQAELFRRLVGAVSDLVRMTGVSKHVLWTNLAKTLMETRARVPTTQQHKYGSACPPRVLAQTEILVQIRMDRHRGQQAYRRQRALGVEEFRNFMRAAVHVIKTRTVEEMVYVSYGRARSGALPKKLSSRRRRLRLFLLDLHNLLASALADTAFIWPSHSFLE